MAHPRLDAHRRTYQARVAGIRGQLAQAERAQLADPNLSAATRRRNIGHLRRQAEAQLGRLRQEYEAGKPAVLRAIVAPLYKLPPKVGADVSWRDAVDRASAIKSQDDALTLLQRARMVGDDIQVTALAYVACPSPEEHPPRWPAVIAAWRRSDERVAGALAEFDDAWAEMQDRGQQYEDSTMFTVPAEQTPPDSDQLPKLQPVPDQPA